MLYIIGGASRSGKTTTANLVLKEVGIPFFSLDYLVMGIANGIPEFGVYPTEGDYITGQRLWVIVNPLMTAMVECIKYNLKYFESSHNFKKTIDKIVSYLVDQ